MYIVSFFRTTLCNHGKPNRLAACGAVFGNIITAYNAANSMRLHEILVRVLFLFDITKITKKKENDQGAYLQQNRNMI